MKVKTVIDKCTELLEMESTREELLPFFNLVENELAVNYLPLYSTHWCNSKIVYFTEFEYNPVRIVGCNCRFKIYPTYIEGKEAITEIQYAYAPNKKELYDECSYNEEFLECLVYGTIYEYLISNGFYEESVAWDKKYKRAIELLMF